MRLKSLELHGFKSFPEKTVIRFDEGATVIVGPNGSGKSNITDAMRWVLGELSSKNIRGAKMEDVIFVGADGFRPMGFAEVSVTFDNTDPATRIDSPYDEITVTRRYYRAGESEYFINRKPVRLRDINELFMNTGIGRDGYSIIGQGRIAEIVSKKSEERRGVFDETAGIAKYRFKKQETQKRLDATEANMLRVSDILSELESRVGPLERQAKKAREYLELFAQKKEADVSLWLYDRERQGRAQEKTRADCALSRHELEMAQDTESQLQSQSERIFGVSQDTKAAAARLYEQIRALTDTRNAAENAAQLLKNELSHAAAEKESTSAEQKRQTEARGEAVAAREAAAAARKETAAALTEAEASLAQTRAARERVLAESGGKEAALSSLLAEQKKHEDALLDLRVRLNVLKNTLESQSERTSGLSADIEKYESERAGLADKRAELEESQRSYDEAVKKEKEAAAAAAAEAATLQRGENETLEALHAAEAAGQALASRIAALKNMLEHFEGYNNSVRYVMSEAAAGRLRGIHGPLSHLISVKPEYTVALETALGGALQNLVVENEQAAKDAIYALKRSGTGRATFYPLTSVKAPARGRDTEEAARYAGFVGFADTLVRAEARYAGVVGSLLARIAVFDTLENATVMARAQNWRVRAVTLDGQQINAGGSFTGGAVRRDSGMLTRTAQIEKLTEEAKEAAARQKKQEEALAAVRAQISAAAARRADAEERARLMETLRRADSAQLEEIDARDGVLSNLLAQLRDDWEKLRAQGERGGTDIENLQAACRGEETTIREIGAQRAALDVERAALDEEADALGAALTDGQVHAAEIRKDLEARAAAETAAEEEIRSLEEAIRGAIARGTQLEEQMAALRTQIAEKEKESAEMAVQLEGLENERSEAESGSMEYEKRLNELRLQLKDISAKKELLVSAHEKNENRLAQITSDIEKMTQRLWDEYELTPTGAAALPYPKVEESSRTGVNARLSELKNQIKALGSVNVAAIDEYAAVKERYDYVSTQMHDLTEAKEDLVGIISMIDEEMIRMFTEAFEKINENFGAVFRELFGGGEAHLSLSDPENVLTSGIEISAAPPGKMIKNLSLLSGGEQAVIAIALLFALVRVNPSPFCIFDEIEAALDEVNVQRVAQYVKRYSETMQIIMITHRRGTMEIADTLYGVTMPRRGVSKVFTLDLSSMTEEDMDRAL